MSFALFMDFVFFFNDTATTEIYTLSLHDALPISPAAGGRKIETSKACLTAVTRSRSEEHTSELQSRRDIVCRLLLEKKKTNNTRHQEPYNQYHEKRHAKHMDYH